MLSLFQILASGAHSGAFPGAVLRVHRGGVLLEEVALGTLDGECKTAPDAIYDLASITKILLLATALRQFRAHRIALRSSLRDFFPSFNASLTLENLMRHASGIETHLQPLHVLPVEMWVPTLGAAPLRESPGVFYNCVNYFLLGRVVSQVEGAPLWAAMGKWLFEPASLDFSFAPPVKKVAPTEYGLRGTVHDEAARVFWQQTGDICGNSGAFSDAHTLARFGDLWSDNSGFFHPEDLRAVSHNAAPEGRGARGLGWQIGAFFSGRKSVWSHLGFTGPLLLLDHRSQTTIAILCNRVFPNRDGPDRMAIFRMIADRVLET